MTDEQKQKIKDYRKEYREYRENNIETKKNIEKI